VRELEDKPEKGDVEAVGEDGVRKSTDGEGKRRQGSTTGSRLTFQLILIH
jgi:hypothetical protein